MAITVPRSSGANSRFIPQAYQNVTVDPAADDQGGAAMQALGGAFDKLSSQAERVVTAEKQAEQAQRDAEKAQRDAEQNDLLREAVLRLEKNSRETVSGEGAPSDPAAPTAAGYLKKNGKEALVDYDAVIKKLENDHQVIRQTIPSEEQRQRFDTAAQAVGRPIKRLLLKHREEQSRVASQNAAENAAEESTKTYIAFSDDEEISQVAWKSGIAETARAATLKGDPAMPPKSAVKQWQSKTHRGMIEHQLGRGRLEQAESYLKKNTRQMEPGDLKAAQTEVNHVRDQVTVDKALKPVRDRLAEGRKTQHTEEPKAAAPKPSPPDGTKAQQASPAGEQGKAETTGQGSGARQPLSTTPPAYPYGKEVEDGLPTMEELQKEFEQTADHSELTETQRDYGWAALRRDYALAKREVRQQRQDDLISAMQLIDGGSTVRALPLDLQNRLEPSSRQGLERYFQRVHELAPDETDWAALDAIAGDSDQAFTTRILAQDRPFLSTPLNQTLGEIQTMMRSNDLQERNHGMRLMRGLRLSTEALKQLPPALRTPARMEMMVGESLRLVHQAIESGKSLTRADIQKHMALYLHEARMEQAWGK